MDVATLNKFASLRAKEAPAPVAGGPPPPQTGEFSWRRFANDKEALEEWVDSLLRVGTQELERMASDEAERAAGASGAAATPTRSKGARAASAARRGAAPLSASTRIGATDAAAAATTSAAEEYVRTREVVDAMARISGIFGSCFEELCGHCAVYSARTAALLTRTWGAQTALVAAASKRLVEQEKRVRSLRRETLGVVESASAKAEQARLAFDWHATGLHEVEVELVHKDARLSTTERQVELLTEENARLRALLAADVFATAAEDGEEEDGGSVGGSGAAQASEQAMKQLEQQMLTLWKSSQKVSSELDAKFQSMEKERARQEHLFGKIRATLDAVTMQTMGMVVTAIEGDGSTAEIGVQTAFDGTHSAEHVVFGGEAPPPIPTTGLRAPAPAHIPLELRPLMASYPHSPRIKSVELLDRLILEYYTEKIASDSAHAKAGTALFTPCEVRLCLPKAGTLRPAAPTPLPYTVNISPLELRNDRRRCCSPTGLFCPPLSPPSLRPQFLYAFLSNRYGLHSLTDPHVVEIAQSVAHHARTSSRVGLFARFIGAGTGAYGSAPELDRRAMDFVLLLLNNLQREGVVTLATGLTNSSGDSAATNGANLEIARSGAIRIVRALGNDPGLTPVKRAQRMRKNSDLPERSITTLATRVERLATPPSGSTRKCLLDDFVNCAVAVWLEDHLRRRRKLQEIFSMCVEPLSAASVPHSVQLRLSSLAPLTPLHVASSTAQTTGTRCD